MKKIINDDLKLGSVSLKVKDLTRSIKFYSDVIGFDLLRSDERTASLGVNNIPYINLVEDSSFIYPDKSYTGLFHVAILVPTDIDLGAILHHFINIGFTIDGAGDHIFSEAIYLRDPDDHGIEIYYDRPKDKWIINEDGTIESGTYEVDIKRLLDISKNETWHKLPIDTTIGHVHLKVADLKLFSDFYVDMLGFDLKTVYRGALFISKNNYHHHIGANIWHGQKAFLPKNMIGLDYITFVVNNIEEIRDILKNNESYKADKNAFFITDNNGITIRFVGSIYE